MADTNFAECLVKPEFMKTSEPPPPPPKEVGDGDNDVKKENGSTKHEKVRGRNHNRPGPIKFNRADKLCPSLNRIRENEEGKQCTFPNCAFQHDVEKYLANKPPDIGEECYRFKNFGICEAGLSCRFGKMHIKDQKYNLVNYEIYKDGNKNHQEKNHVERDLKDSLRKKKYDFKTTDKIVDKMYKLREAEKAMEEKEQISSNENDEPQIKKIKIEESVESAKTTLNDEDGKPYCPCENEKPTKKKIDWENKLYLAPLTTVGNLPFRRICKNMGADITCGEMAMTEKILQGHQPEWALVQRHVSEDIFGIQLCGCHPHQFGRVAQLIEDGHIDVDFIDLNLGCPIDLVYKRGMGSGLMVRKKPLEVMIKSMTEVMTRPLTVKIRTGIYMDKKIAHNLAPNLRNWGADLVTIHGRSREQRYTKLADWDYIGEVAKSIAPTPLFGNGDIFNYEDYNEFKAKSNVSGCMIARGALIKPWIFTEIKEQRHWDISANERLDMIKDYANFGLEHWGSDDKGVENTRRFLLEWLSFLHRYVPVGVLERLPQRMNERVPKYFGRSDLETLLSSANGQDWVKITEMFLGPVPDGFSFEPKHKANGYK